MKCKQRCAGVAIPPRWVLIYIMKKFIMIIGAISVAACGVSCESVNAGAGVPVPFTDNGAGAPVKVAVDINAKLLPPKFFIGLDVVGE